MDPRESIALATSASRNKLLSPTEQQALASRFGSACPPDFVLSPALQENTRIVNECTQHDYTRMMNQLSDLSIKLDIRSPSVAQSCPSDPRALFDHKSASRRYENSLQLDDTTTNATRYQDLNVSGIKNVQ